MFKPRAFYHHNSMTGDVFYRPSLANPSLFWGTILGSFLFAFIPLVVKLCSHLFCYETEKELVLRRQIMDLKSELKGINMVDEFSKYAKLERRIRKLTDEAAVLVRKRFTKQEKAKVIASALLYVLGVLFAVTMLWMYKEEPILILNEEWLYPFHSLISYPSDLPGVLGFTAWVIICGRVARIAAQATK